LALERLANVWIAGIMSGIVSIAMQLPPEVGES
jgi:hypothetical protein